MYQPTQRSCERLHSDFHKTWSIVRLSAAPWYILSYAHGQNVPRRLYKRGHSLCNNASPVTVDTRQLDPGVSRSFVSTDLCFFYPPLNLKPLSFHFSPPASFSLPPSPTHSSHTHTNKEMGPLQFILLALWNPGLLQGSGGKKIIGRGFN